MPPATRVKAGVAGVLVLVTILAGTSPAWAVSPPGQPTSGYGSTQHYISSGATEHAAGNELTGTKVWWYVPNTLRNTTSAPVVVLLHGFALLAPDIYRGQIDHLTRQGYIVVYPQINQGFPGLLFDNNQNTMMSRAIASTNTALGQLGSTAGPLHLYGHSLGGLLAASWTGSGGPAVQSVTLANPSTGAGGPLGGTGIDWHTRAPATTARTIILTGNSDTIAASSQSVDLFNAMGNASSRIVYQAQSDGHASPALDADHMAPIQDDGIIPSFMMDFLGGDGEQDAMDFRFYYAALDAQLDGRRTVPFAPGTWTDGQPVTAPTILAADVPDPPSAPSGLTGTPGDTTATLSWTASVDNGGRPITAYRVYRDGSLIHTAGAEATGHTDTGRTNGTTYAYIVRAVNAQGESLDSNTASVTPRTVPGAPTGPSAVGAVADVHVDWDPPASNGGSAVTAYRVTRDGALVHTTANGATTSYTDPAPACGRHRYAVTAVNAAGAGPSSADARVLLLPPHTSTDVAPAGQTADAVRWATCFGVVPGFADNTFRPATAVNRSQLVGFLWRLVDRPAGSAPASFSDVPANAPYRPALDWARARNVLNGYPDGTFRPRTTVTRAQLVRSVWRLAGSPTGAPAHGFTDVPANASYRVALNWAQANHLVNTYPGNRFKPTRDAKRGDTTVLLHRLASTPEAWDAYPGPPPSTVTFG